MPNALNLLDELLDDWRKTRTIALESAIHKVSATLAPPDAPSDQEAWIALARRDRTSDLSALLETAHDCKKAAIPNRYDALLSRRPDPRLGVFFLASIADPPTLSQSKYSMYTAMFRALPDLVDERAAESMRNAAENPKGKSKFWAKLAKSIENTIPKLPPAKKGKPFKVPAKLTVPDLSQVRDDSPSLPKRQLAKSLAGLTKQATPEDALDQLVDVWGTTRDPALADVIAALTDALNAPPFEGTDAAWLEAAKTTKPSQRGPLLATYADAKTGTLIKRTRAMRGWSSDPRVAGALHEVVADPLRGGNRDLWDEVYRGFIQHADPRTTDEIQSRRDAHEGYGDGDRVRAERAALRAHTDAIIAASTPMAGISARDREELGRLVIPKRRPQEGAAEETSLLDAIVSDRETLGPIQVYADWLVERDDPRGAFIQLELALAAGKRVKSKRDRFFKKHRGAILGPLNEILTKFNVVFRDGLLSRAPLRLTETSFRKTDAELERLVTDPRWRTVEWLGRPISNVSMVPILSRARLDRLKKIGLHHADELRALARQSPPLEELTLWFRDDAWGAFSMLQDAPLKKLDFSAQGEESMPVPKPLRPVLGGLTEFTVRHRPLVLSEWLSALERAERVELSLDDVSAVLSRRGEVFDVEVDSFRLEEAPGWEAMRAMLREAVAFLGTLNIEGQDPVAASTWAKR